MHRAELLESGGDRATFEIECSSGTYIRTLVETLQDAYCESLRRTAIGDLRLVDGEEPEIDVSELVGFLPERVLDADEVVAVGHGRVVAGPPGRTDVSGPVPGDPRAHVRLTHDGDLIAIARRDGDNLKPEVVFR